MKELVDVMKILRGPHGCPWDKEQTYESLMSCLLEETYEIIDASLQNKYDKLEEELGDILCIISMIIAMGENDGYFSKKSVIKGAVRKMKHRHPHVFGNEKASTSGSAHDLWHRAKGSEKGVRARKSVLDDLSNEFPALMRADKIQRRVARVGFDWPDIRGVIDKLEEELDEIKKELKKKKKNSKNIQEELGDLLFAVVNLGRKLNINSEISLRKTNSKFIKRFKYIEAELRRQKKVLGNVPLKELDVMWNRAKKDLE